MQNDKCKMQNECVRFADLFKSFPKEIQQFCIFHFALCISRVARQIPIYLLNIFPGRHCISRQNLLYLLKYARKAGISMKSIRELYKIGKGPSSSHTMGPEMIFVLQKKFAIQPPPFGAIISGFVKFMYGKPNW